ncbi:unnamed protein product [Sphagnum jensenii]|uniref:Phototropic-responsive NPH3 family protein n=1 Tax=Sphagnum jensenii TaxID=128206 RepID=A0ABP1B4K9_9BRYO
MAVTTTTVTKPPTAAYEKQPAQGTAAATMNMAGGRRPSRSNFLMKRTNEWALTTDVPSDIVVEAAGLSFSLHKFPLVARCGRIRKLISTSGELDNRLLQLPDVPGGAEAFELAAKFCYGINFDITIYNVALLRCAAEYLEMTEAYGDNNLIARTEKFLSEMVLLNLADSIAVLHNCENLLPFAEEVKIVSRCIEAAATKACREQGAHIGLIRASDYGGTSGRSDFKFKFNSNTPRTPSVDWWAENLTVLRIDFYQRVLAAMRSKGLRPESIGGAIMLYAHRSLKGLHKIKQTAPRNSDAIKWAMEHELRMIVETIVNLLPPEKNATLCSFLVGLLRTTIILDTTLECRLELERRVGMQLEQATLDDLLIPSFSNTGDHTLFDVDIVHRIIENYLQQEEKEDHELQDVQTMYESSDDRDGGGGGAAAPLLPLQTASSIKVAKLVDTYLAEIAPDANLKLSKFLALAELLPDYARTVDDGLYRAIDIYLKAHPVLTEAERKKLCKLMDCQKLSQEACTHAAQNERLPIHVVVQILYFEQLRLRSAFKAATAAPGAKDNYASVRRENQELKLEIARMRMRITDLEKDHVYMKQDMEKGNRNKFLSSVSRRFSKLNPFVYRGGRDSRSSMMSIHNATTGLQTPEMRRDAAAAAAADLRRRRHSIS